MPCFPLSSQNFWEVHGQHSGIPKRQVQKPTVSLPWTLLG